MGLVKTKGVGQTLKGIDQITEQLSQEGRFGRKGKETFEFVGEKKFLIINTKFKAGFFFVFVNSFDFFERSNFIIGTVGDGGRAGKFFGETDIKFGQGPGDEGVFDDLKTAAGLFDFMTKVGGLSSGETLVLKEGGRLGRFEIGGNLVNLFDFELFVFHKKTR